jgi:hypothetical protein
MKCSVIRFFENRSAYHLRMAMWMLAFSCLAGQARPAACQDMHSGHSPTMRTEPPPEQLPPPQKLSGIGNASLAITAGPEAQRWFNQGLNLLHDFWDYESARAFEQSIRADPQCAMCYWGLYQAESNYHSTVKDYSAAALSTAARLESRANEAERLPRKLCRQPLLDSRT